MENSKQIQTIYYLVYILMKKSCLRKNFFVEFDGNKNGISKSCSSSRLYFLSELMTEDHHQCVKIIPCVGSEKKLPFFDICNFGDGTHPII